nr:hypothetical protein [Tanacetum cinerariifolium]
MCLIWYGDVLKKDKDKEKTEATIEVHSPSSEIPIKESIPTPSNDPLPSGEDSIQLNELMIFYTNLQQQVIDLEEAKITQAKEIANLKKRVRKLKKRRKSRPAGLRRLKKVGSSKRVKSYEEIDSLGAQEDASKQGRSIKDINQDVEIALFDEALGRMHDADITADPVTTADEVVTTASVEDSAAPITITTADVDDELTLAKTLITIKAAKEKVISKTATTVTTAITTPRAKGKAKMIELEKPLKKKDQITLDEEVARKQLAEQIQAQEREQLSIKERSKLFVELIESRKKYFAAKRPKEIRNKPPTEAQQKSIMCTYMKNIEGFKQKDFKGKSFDDIKKIFDKVYKRVNTFVDMNIENVEESLKITQAEVTKGSSKRERQELECLEIVPEDDDVAIKATPLSSKSPTIVDSKICKEGKKSYFKIIRADGNSQNYLIFRTMFKNFNRKDLEVLRSIVKESILHQLWSDVRLQVDYEIHAPNEDKDLIKKLEDLDDEHQVLGRIFMFKGLHGVTTAQLVMLVYKVTSVFNKVNAAKSRVTTAAKKLKIYSLGSIGIQWEFLRELTCGILETHLAEDPNGDALRKCIFSGPYKPTTVLVQAVAAIDDSPAIPENKAHFQAEKEAIHLILTGIGDEIYSIVDACQTAQEMWEAIERLQQGESLNIQDLKTNLFWEFGKFTSHDGETMESNYTGFYKVMSEMIRNNLTVAMMQFNNFSQNGQGKKIAKSIIPPSETASEEDNDPEQAQGDKDMQKNLALIAKYFKKIYKPTNNNLRTSSNSRNKNVDTTPRYKNDNQSGQFGNQRTVNVAGARENVGRPVVQQFGIQCFNYKEFGHFAKECRKPKRVKDSTYDKEKMLLCKQAEQGVPL